MRESGRASSLRICLVYPQVLGTYGDGGNAEVLLRRCQWRGLPAEVVTVDPGAPVPSDCDVYLLGGSEDGPQPVVARRLAADGGLQRAVDAGAAVLGVCGGLQILGEQLPGPDGPVDGLGLLPAVTRLPDIGAIRTVGHVVAQAPGLGDVIGFENHRAVTELRPGADPLGVVVRGLGNGVADAAGRPVEGAVAGRVVGTYLHGPVLALNPLLADRLLACVAGELAPLPDDVADVAELDLVRARRLQIMGVRPAA